MVSFNLRKQQIVYAIAILLGAITCVAAGFVKRYHDIPFDGDLRSQYFRFSNNATILLETSVAFVIFMSLYTLIDVLRPRATTIWIELVWPFVFAIVEVINIVILANNYPSAHCRPAPETSLSRRDSPDDSIFGQNTNTDMSATRAKASKHICGNWAALFVLFTMIATLLFLHWSWLAVLGLRHRLSHPDFFWFGEVPVPLTWNLPPPSASETSASADDSASISTSSSFDEKKADLISPPAPIQIRLPPTREVGVRVC